MSASAIILAGLKGVGRADVSLKAEEAVVTFDPEQVTVIRGMDCLDFAHGSPY